MLPSGRTDCISYRNAGKITEKLHLWGLKFLGNHLYCKWYWKNSQTAPSNSSVSRRANIFWIHLRKTRKVIILIVCGLGGRDHDSRNKWFSIFEAPRHFKTSETHPTYFLNMNLGNSAPVKTWFWEMYVPTLLFSFDGTWHFETLTLWNSNKFETLNLGNLFISRKGIPLAPNTPTPAPIPCLMIWYWPCFGQPRESALAIWFGWD